MYHPYDECQAKALLFARTSVHSSAKAIAGRSFDSDIQNPFMDRNIETTDKNESLPSPDKNTLHTTDPQENMEGPMSSPTKGTGDVFDSDENKKHANEKKKDRM